MVDSPLACLLGQVVTDAATIHDYVQLAFGTGMGLSIFNDFEISPEPLRLADLVGLRVSAVLSSADEEVIRFENGRSLRVDLRDQAFRGPEAMNLYQAGRPPVVWN
jgi:hypothetical protein